MKIANYSFAPSNASDEVKKMSKYVLKSKGGEGVVDEIYEMFFKKLI